jgi:hypothetical protein
MDGPTAKTFVCPHCSERLVSRRRSEQDVLLRAVDKERDAAEQERARHREQMLRQANDVGASDAEFTDAEEEMSARFGFPANPADVFWGIANQAAIQAAAAGEWHRAGQAYRVMAKHLFSEGRAWADVQRQAVLADLRGASWGKDSDVLTIVGCDCQSCSGTAPKTVTRADALAAGPPPHPDCAKPPCRCWLMEDRSTPRVIEVPITITLPPTTSQQSVPEEPVERTGFLSRFFGR